MTAGRWKSAKMSARHTQRQAADRGAVARDYQESGVNVAGSRRQRGFESIKVGPTRIVFESLQWSASVSRRLAGCLRG